MICPDCGFEVEALPCADCAEDRARRKRERQVLIRQFALERGGGRDPAERASFARALDCLRTFLAAEGSETDLRFREEDVLYSACWWYVPAGFVGCAGYLVDRADGLVHALGSCHPLDVCFWAQNRGFRARFTDFVIEEIGDLADSVGLVSRFAWPEGAGNEVYGTARARAALASLPARFLRHTFWFELDDLRRAEGRGVIRFTAAPSRDQQPS